jgi:hypothetical protein
MKIHIAVVINAGNQKLTAAAIPIAEETQSVAAANCEIIIWSKYWLTLEH